jgi:hypothetical protein
VNSSSGEDYAQAFEDDPFYSNWKEVPNKFRCTNPEAQPIASVCYWVVFILCSAFVMLSLFVGAVTGAMQRSLLTAEEREEKALYLKRMKRQREKIQLAAVKLEQAQRNKFKKESLRKEHSREMEKVFIGLGKERERE